MQSPFYLNSCLVEKCYCDRAYVRQWQRAVLLVHLSAWEPIALIKTGRRVRVLNELPFQNPLLVTSLPAITTSPSLSMALSSIDGLCPLLTAGDPLVRDKPC